MQWNRLGQIRIELYVRTFPQNKIVLNSKWSMHQITRYEELCSPEWWPWQPWGWGAPLLHSAPQVALSQFSPCLWNPLNATAWPCQQNCSWRLFSIENQPFYHITCMQWISLSWWPDYLDLTLMKIIIIVIAIFAIMMPIAHLGARTPGSSSRGRSSGLAQEERRRANGSSSSWEDTEYYK